MRRHAGRTAVGTRQALPVAFLSRFQVGYEPAEPMCLVRIKTYAVFSGSRHGTDCGLHENQARLTSHTPSLTFIG